MKINDYFNHQDQKKASENISNIVSLRKQDEEVQPYINKILEKLE